MLPSTRTAERMCIASWPTSPLDARASISSGEADRQKRKSVAQLLQEIDPEDRLAAQYTQSNTT